ncbi:MAG: hypothetical protein RQ752_11055 [Thermohalobaculum sp.]|nr:hypothetical protein [Thermohalobaculum sp.]
MGQYDAEIKKAQKIASDWAAQTAKSLKYFTDLKKINVKWDKDHSKVIEAAIKNNDPAAQIMKMIDDAEKYLAQIETEGTKEYQVHYDWARGEPRAGVGGICKALGLKNGTEGYKEVDKALQKVLIGFGKQIAETESAWTRDVKPAIDILRNRLDTLKKVASGAERMIDASVKQLQKEIVAFNKLCSDATGSLKITTDQGDVDKLQKGAFDGWDDKTRAQKRQTYQKKIDVIPKLEAQLVKNHGRIVKAIPDNLANSQTLKRLRVPLDKALEDARKDLQYALKLCQTLDREFGKKYPNS